MASPVLLGHEEHQIAQDMKPKREEALEITNRLTYAVELACEEPDTRHWRHPWCMDKNGGELALRPPILPQGIATTIPNCFNLAAQKFGEAKCMGTRPILECTLEGNKQYWTKGDYTWKSYAEVHADVTAVAQGLLSLPSVMNKRVAGEECVAAVLAETSSEWQVSAQASLQCGITLTTIYTTLGKEAMLHGLNETKAMVLFIDWTQYNALKDAVISNCPALEHIVVIGRPLVPLATVGSGSDAMLAPFPSVVEARELPQIGNARSMSIEGLIEMGRSSSLDLAGFAPSADDVAFIMYTSGSTGLPKGVVLTHKNFVAVIASAIAQGVVTPTPEDVYLAYLPLAHILELMVETATICQGATIGYGHPRTLTSSSPFIYPSNPEGSDLLALRPTLMAAVPAILDLIKSGLTKKVQEMPGLKGKLVADAIRKSLGLAAKKGDWRKTIRQSARGALLDCGVKNVLLKKVREGLGLDRLRLMISGGAPLCAETQDFVTAVLAPVAQGYGATETSGCATVQEVLSSGGRPADLSSGHVGAIQPASEIKLVSVPDMGYLVTDPQPRGEILISGNNVSQTGYYRMPEKSAEDFPKHSDGKIWFHTGDIGVMTETGILKIVDRKKDLIKLTGGEYVSLGKVEAALKQVSGIGACVVFARPDKDHCVVVVSQPEKGWSSVGGRPEVESLEKAISEKLRSMGLARFEIPAKVQVDDAIWTPESGLVTASLKVQRNPLRTHYNQIGGLLEQMNYRFPDA
jgi:long-chain acyl-CoA synthetase